MSVDLKEFFMNLSLDGFFSNVPHLGAMSMLSNKDISKYELSSIDRNIHIYINNIRNYGDLVLKEKYNVIFSKNNPKNYEKIDAEVDYLSLKKNDNIGVMPDGTGGVVRLKFKSKLPEMLKMLRQNDDEQFDNVKHKYLTFTTQEVMDKILEQ